MGGVQASMLKEPNQFGRDSLIFHPFTWQVWIAFCTLWFFYSFILYSTTSLGRKMTSEITKNSSNSRSIQREEKVSLIQSLYHFSLGAVHFGVERNLEQMLSSKILHFFWSFLMMILVSSYTANLAAVFSENEYEKPVQVGRRIFPSEMIFENDYLAGPSHRPSPNINCALPPFFYKLGNLLFYLKCFYLWHLSFF